MSRGQRKICGATALRLVLPILSAVALSAGGAASPPYAESTTVSDPTTARSLATFDSLWTAGAHEDARRHLAPLRQQARAERDTTLLTTVLLRLGRSHVLLGDGRGAEPHLAEALALATARRDTAGLTPITRWLGVALGLQRRMDESLTLYRQLRALANATGDRHHQAWAAVGLGWHDVERRDLAAAITQYRHAIMTFDKLEDCRGELWARNALGVALHRAGDYRAALAGYDQTFALATECGTPVIATIARTNMASLHFDLGRPDLAMDLYAEAVRFYEQAGQQRERVVAATNMGQCLALLGRHDEARRLYASELRFSRDQNLRDQHAVITTRLAELDGDRGRHRAAIAAYGRVVDLANDAPNRTSIAMTTANLADALVGLSDELAAVGEAADGWRVIRPALDDARFDDDLNSRVLLRHAGARRLLELDQTAEALPHLEFVAARAPQGELSGIAVAALADAAECHRRSGERERALSLLKTAADNWEQERQLPLDPQWRELRGTSGRRVFTELAAALMAAREGTDAVTAAFDVLQSYKSRTLLERMLGPGPTLGREATSDVDLARLQTGILKDGEVLLDYHLGPRTSFLFAVTRTSIRCHRLPPAPELAPLLRRFHGLLAEPGNGDLQVPARGLATMMLGGAADLLAGATSVVVASDGEIHLLPLGLLRTMAGDDGGAGEAADRTWSRVPSAGALARLREWNRLPGAEPMRLLAVASSFDDRGAMFAGAVREVADLARRYRNVDLRVTEPGQAFSTEADLAGYGILHLATHVRVDDHNPWQSEIGLVPAAVDNPRAADIAGLELSARLAVLSGCSTAGGRLITGEGVSSLASAFLGAGVPAVLATLWEVDDAVTAELIARFYAELTAGHSLADALRRAQASVRSRPATVDPFYWAGFVLIGDGDLQLQLERRRVWSQWTWLVPLVLLGLGLGIVRHRLRGQRPGRRILR
ncbi:MAG: CHAT domain-containing protein [bacterium]|nr:CHAT domain-containing protein [bacterium]